MPAGLIMMMGSIGMQFFNNYANNKKQDELANKQKEFQKAMLEHDFERTQRLQAEATKINAELEAEFHADRMKEIENEYDNVLSQYISSIAIDKWPLNVLPFIMRGEGFGSLISGGSKTIAMHCILTPSNCEKFNKHIYQDLDLRLEAEMNNNWNIQSTHPVVYYGGAWRKPLDPINLTEIQLLHTQLKSVPTMIITPYFDDKLYFRISLWGMGKDQIEPFNIVPQKSTNRVKEDGDFIFSYKYMKGMEYLSEEDICDDLYNRTLEEFIPYLESLIGSIADKYFWCMYGEAPLLPSILKNNESYSFKILLNEYMSHYIETINLIFKEEKCNYILQYPGIINYIRTIFKIINDDDKLNLERLLLDKARVNLGFLEQNINFSNISELEKCIKNEIEVLNSCQYYEIQNFPISKYLIKEVSNIDLVDIVDDFLLFISKHADRLSVESLSLYIEQEKYKTFKFHMYDNVLNQICSFHNGFNLVYKSEKVKKIKNVKTIFKNKDHASIICKYSKLGVLKNELISDNLIF